MSQEIKVEKKWRVLLITTVGTSLVFLDNTIIPVAIPTIQRELHFSDVGGLWIVNAYLLTLITLLFIGGKLVELFGKRELYFVSFGCFTVGSLLGSFSVNGVSLIAARILQGMGGALMLPTNSALLLETFPLQQRAKAIGFNTGISALFLILGPVLGGLFTTYLNWRYVFYVNLPILAFGAWMTYTIVPKEKRKKGSFKFMEALFIILSIISLVVGLMEGSSMGWKEPIIIALLLASPLLFFLHLYVCRGATAPFVNLALFKNFHFRWATLCIFICQLITILTIEWAIYFQKGLHYSAFHAGLLVLLATCPVGIMAVFSGILADRKGARWPIIVGFTLLIVALVWISYFSKPERAHSLFPGLIVFGCGIPLIFSPAFATAMREVEERQFGPASSMITMSRQLAATLGIALMTALFESVLAHTDSYASAFQATLFLGIGFACLGLMVAIRFVRK